jgi:hypothetical protein
VYITPKDEIFAYFSFSGVGKLIKAGLYNRQCYLHRRKFIGSVVDTGKQFFGGDVDTGDKF